jgi:predicted secreted acid phosphatase
MAGSHAYIDLVTVDPNVKYAVNFDIDNSSLATYYRKGTAIPAVLSFATYAHENHGVALLFNTARTGKALKRARSLLTRAGYPVSEVCGRKSHHETLVHGKRRCRALFISEGFTIIANVGNRDTDFSGAQNYGRAFRLPNYGNRLA